MSAETVSWRRVFRALGVVALALAGAGLALVGWTFLFAVVFRTSGGMLSDVELAIGSMACATAAVPGGVLLFAALRRASRLSAGERMLALGGGGFALSATGAFCALLLWAFGSALVDSMSGADPAPMPAFVQ